MIETLTWSAVETALAVRPSWRRVGREWHGPCPVTGDGRDTCWFAPGDRSEVRAGCRRCGTRLRPADFRSHLDAVLGRPLGPVPAFRPCSRSRSAALLPVHPSPAALWAAATSVSPSTDAPYRYLTAHRRVVAHDGDVPSSVRWLPASDALWLRCRPRLPAAAVGALVYRFAAPSEEETVALQLEALGHDGSALRFLRAGKRPSVAGSAFDTGRRVFVATLGTPGAGCWLVEGPLDALALVRLSDLGLEDLRGAAVFGVAGAPAGFQLRACSVPGPVVLAPDPDAAGDRSVLNLGAVLASRHHPFRVCRPVQGMDWSDMVLEASLEKEMLHHENPV